MYQLTRLELELIRDILRASKDDRDDEYGFLVQETNQALEVVENLLNHKGAPIDE